MFWDWDQRRESVRGLCDASVPLSAAGVPLVSFIGLSPYTGSGTSDRGTCRASCDPGPWVNGSACSGDETSNVSLCTAWTASVQRW